jgi:purine-nucleoside phosphorylase
VASSDLFYDPRGGAVAGWASRGALAVEMEAATIFQIAARRGVAAACVLGVTDVPGSNGARRMTAEELVGLGVRVGEAGYAALRSP